nr:integrase, catalytic region, zinc finger, CCHC-type, peptidase aspartic, catalytic [Tanacetum cinerariifolium]
MMSEKKVNTKPVDYDALKQLSKDFETCFVPQTELSAEQAFWSQNFGNSKESNLSSSTTIVEVPKELPKVSMTSLDLFVFEAFWNDSHLQALRFPQNLEVAFRQHTCFIRNLDGVDLLTGSRGNNLYTLSIKDMMASSPICLLSKSSKTKSWLWHRRLSHLNFSAINNLARQGLVRGLIKLKFEKDHLCSACAMGKSKKKSYKPKSEDTNQEKTLCYPTNDNFDELMAMASEQSSLGPALNEMTPATISSRLVQKPSSLTPYVPPSRKDWDLLFQSMFEELLNPPPSVDPQAPEVIAPIADTYKDALTQSCWIEAMQEELNEFERLE